jgi:hypothetical protein
MAEEKTAMSQAKKKSTRDCREKTPMSSKKIRKTPKTHPWRFLFPSHKIFDIKLFLLQKASSNPKTDPGRKRKKKHTLHGSRKPTKRLKRREENHQQIRRSKTQRGRPPATEEEEDQNTDRDGS